MANTICRKCGHGANVIKESTYKYKKLVTMECANPRCKNTWIISVRPNWKISDEKIPAKVCTGESKGDTIPKTAMELAFEKAMGKKKSTTEQ